MRALLLFLTFACKQEAPIPKEPPEKQPLVKEPTVEERAKALAQKLIIVDGHVDIPYRLYESKDEDISQRTPKGDFDYVRAKEGGLDAPFMSIYVPAKHQETGGAKKLADELIDM